MSFPEGPRLIAPQLSMAPQLRSPTSAGPPLILAQRMQPMTPTTQATGMLNGGPPPLVSPADAGLIYPYDYPFTPHPYSSLLEYPTSIDQSAAGTYGVR